MGFFKPVIALTTLAVLGFGWVSASPREEQQQLRGARVTDGSRRLRSNILSKLWNYDSVKDETDPLLDGGSIDGSVNATTTEPTTTPTDGTSNGTIDWAVNGTANGTCGDLAQTILVLNLLPSNFSEGIEFNLTTNGTTTEDPATNTTTTIDPAVNGTSNDTTVIEPTTAPVVEPTTAPVIEATTAPVVEPTTPPVIEATTAPVVEATTAPVIDPATNTTPTTDPITTDPFLNYTSTTNTTEAAWNNTGGWPLGVPGPWGNFSGYDSNYTGNGSFDAIIEALNITGLVSVLANVSTNYTLFLPTDDAFAAAGLCSTIDLTTTTVVNCTDISTVNITTLTETLLYHVVSGVIDAEGLVAAGYVSTVEGGNVTVASPGNVTKLDGSQGPYVYLTDATGTQVNVTRPDIIACNGIIHIIDGVLTAASNTSANATSDTSTNSTSDTSFNITTLV